jgi:hypothetical protein
MKAISALGLLMVGCSGTSLMVPPEYLLHVRAHIVDAGEASQSKLVVTNLGRRRIGLRIPSMMFMDHPGPTLTNEIESGAMSSQTLLLPPHEHVDLPLEMRPRGKFAGVFVMVSDKEGKGERVVWSDNRVP